jgi:autophagy-related protein 2
MDYIFHSLTDIALRRLYKFILKRTIGKYLEKELLIEQLQVTSRDGVVRLNDISLKVDVINDEFFQSGQPMLLLDSVVISSLEVHMSYSTILTESCRFVIDHMEIVLRPNCCQSHNDDDDDDNDEGIGKNRRLDTITATTNSNSSSGVGVDSAAPG